jgi:hypothetical protein
MSPITASHISRVQCRWSDVRLEVFSIDRINMTKRVKRKWWPRWWVMSREDRVGMWSEGKPKDWEMAGDSFGSEEVLMRRSSMLLGMCMCRCVGTEMCSVRIEEERRVGNCLVLGSRRLMTWILKSQWRDIREQIHSCVNSRHDTIFTALYTFSYIIISSITWLYWIRWCRQCANRTKNSCCHVCRPRYYTFPPFSTWETGNGNKW